MHEEPIFATAVILDAISPRAFRAELPNGKPIVAHLPRRNAALADSIHPGTRARVALTPFDFDKGRIEGLESPETEAARLTHPRENPKPSSPPDRAAYLPSRDARGR